MPGCTIAPTNSLALSSGVVNTTCGRGRMATARQHFACRTERGSTPCASSRLGQTIGCVSAADRQIRHGGGFRCRIVFGSDNLVARNPAASAESKPTSGIRPAFAPSVRRPCCPSEHAHSPRIAGGNWLIWPDSFGRSDRSNHYQCHNRYRWMGCGCCDRSATVHASRSTP